jgi:paraquat-inducible protein B
LSIKKAIFMVLMANLLAAAQAKAASRDDLVNQIEEAIGKPTPIAEQSPLVTNTLTAARTANPDVDARTWGDVRADTAAVLTQMSSGPGSTFDKRIRAALESFSDSELQSLNSKLNDPLLLRFRRAVQSLPHENPGGAMSNMLQIVVEINAILTKHNLKTISFQ